MKMTFAFAVTMILVFVLCTTLQTRAGSILLEQGNYAEETLGDLDKAIGIYEKVVGDPQVSRDDVAEALFRLAQCQLKKGNRVEAGTTLNKLVLNYPGQSRFIGKARELRAKLQNETAAEAVLNASDSNRAVNTRMPFPNLLTAKWPHGQTRKWRISPLYDRESYKSIYTSINSATINGKKYLCFEALNMLPRQYYRVFVEQETFRPFLGYGKTDLLTLQIKYGADKIEVKWDEQGLERSKSIPVNGFVFDDYQTALAAEHLPWSEGVEVIIQEFSAKDLALRELRMSVIGRETVTIPAGTFDCYKITTEIKKEDSWVHGSESWISVEKNIAVKAIMGLEYSVELVETTIEPKSISSFQESALEFLYK